MWVHVGVLSIHVYNMCVAACACLRGCCGLCACERDRLFQCMCTCGCAYACVPFLLLATHTKFGAWVDMITYLLALSVSVRIRVIHTRTCALRPNDPPAWCQPH